jgi:hypothetical protein
LLLRCWLGLLSEHTPPFMLPVPLCCYGRNQVNGREYAHTVSYTTLGDAFS